jgi:hypothetical protein
MRRHLPLIASAAAAAAVVAPTSAVAATTHHAAPHAANAAALITLSSNPTQSLTRHTVKFAGTVSPANPGGVVQLQVENPSTGLWHTLQRSHLSSDSSFQFKRGWRQPGPETVRIYVPRSAKYSAAGSAPSTVTVQQRQNPSFTISTSEQQAMPGDSLTISGNLYTPNTTTAQAGVTVGLYNRPGRGHAFKLVGTTTTATDGSYGFTVPAANDGLYRVRTMTKPAETTTSLYQTVQDQVTLASNVPSVSLGTAVTFTGTVSPAKTHGTAYLEALGTANQWHVVATGAISSQSTFSIPYSFPTAGTKQFRVRILGDYYHVGGTSASVTVTAS